MKRYTYLFMMLLSLLLVACGNNDQENNASNNKESAKQKDEQTEDESVDVKKGLLNVEVTLPASMFEGEDIDTVIADAKKEGVKEVTKNEDGSLTYKMSKAKHKEMMEELKTGILETIEETKNSEDYVSIKDITHNDSFSEFTLVVEKSAYEDSMDGFAAFGLGISGMYYQLYNGVDPDDYKVTIFLKDEASQEVFDEIVYPDDLEEEDTE
ncbi:hypothetical protein [Metabacillus halosaccharovorans]|uniref:Antigen I/II N-terminal domain-containing protein n=1 Tax=Metabacillus halosaccharovorans TaxID=930124 RepID=A0ABT3DI23_9BACI|nr:hypothetical protein [Metabacillus halosaccharovorans]MCV9886702.1 hypothetical protein [Metabacillus halosaccharovorans]